MYVIGTNKAHDIILIHEVKTKHEGVRYMEHIHRAYQLAVKTIDKSVAKGILHKNTAARKKSSIARKLNGVA